jgi:hypothetical protein
MKASGTQRLVPSALMHQTHPFHSLSLGITASFSPAVMNHGSV